MLAADAGSELIAASTGTPLPPPQLRVDLIVVLAPRGSFECADCACGWGGFLRFLPAAAAGSTWFLQENKKEKD